MSPEFFTFILILAIVSYFFDYKLKLNILRRSKTILKVAIPSTLLFLFLESFGELRGFWEFGGSSFHIFNLPVEDVLLFIIVPYVSITLWESSLKIFYRRK